MQKDIQKWINLKKFKLTKPKNNEKNEEQLKYKLENKQQQKCTKI